MNAYASHGLQGLRQDVELMCRCFPDMVVLYRDTLGLPVVTQWSGVVRLDGGRGRWLTLWRTDPAVEHRQEPFGRHSGVCFAVEDLDRLYRSLRSSGQTFASAPCRQPWGATMVNLIDPEDRLVTFVQQRAGLRDWHDGPIAGDADGGDATIPEAMLLSAAR